MNFELTEEQQQIKASVREFAESEILPHVMEWDESQHFPEELRPQLAELGLMGILFPEEYGGAGMGYVEYATLSRKLRGLTAQSVFRWRRKIRFALITYINSAAKSKNKNISCRLPKAKVLARGA